MTDAVTFPGEMTDNPEAVAGPQTPYLCETCGVTRGRYVVADLEKADTSLFCERDLIVTFATVANEVFKEME